MRWWLKVAVFSLVTLVLLPEAMAVAAEPLDEFVEEFATEKMTEARVPGMVFIQVDDDGVVVAAAYGSADLATGRAMTTETPLRVGSISKPVTAALALELAAAGRLNLDLPVDHHLGVDLSDAYGSASTIRQLLQHRGGYPDAFVGSHHLDRRDAVGLNAWTTRVPGRPLAPDVVASYSSVGYTLAGAAVAAAADAAFEQAADEVLFAPLGMHRATFAQPAPDDIAIGYAWDDGYQPYPIDIPDLTPAAGLVASAGDIANFMTALLDEAGPLSQQTKDALLTRAGPDPGLRGYTTGLTEWRYGNRAVLYQEGNGIGTTSRMMILPGAGVGIFTAVNGEALTGLGEPSSQTRFLRDLHERVIDHFYPDPWSMTTAPSHVGEGVPTKDVVGTYVPTRVDPDSVMRLEALVTQFEVTETAGGIVFDGTSYDAASTGVYRNGADGIAFYEGPAGMVYATHGGTSSYRRASWWEAIGVAISVIGGSLLALSVGLTIGVRRAPNAIKCLMAVTSLTAVAFVGLLGFGLSTVDVMDLFTGLPTPIRLARAAAVGVLVSTVALAVTSAVRSHALARRVLAGTVAVTIGGIALTVWAWAWAVLPV